MISFTAVLHKFGEQGEKTGWTYIEVPNDIAEQLNKGIRKSYRVKGSIDAHPIKGVAILPMGDGSFILPVNATMRKGIAKKVGAMVQLKLAVDKDVYELNEALVAALALSDRARQQFYAMPRSHQNYYSKWIESAKQQATQEKRIVMTILSLERGLSYAEMLREQSAARQ